MSTLNAQASSLLPLLLALSFALASPLFADDFQTVDRYLEKLGAVDLRLLHRERELQQATKESQQESLARELADLYAQRLLELNDVERFAELARRMEKLMTRFPQVDSPALRLMLLQAEYQQGETAALRWIDDPSDTAARTKASEIFRRTAGELKSRREQLNKQVDDLLAKVDDIEATSKPGKKSKTIVGAEAFDRELAARQTLLARALFFEGWTELFQSWLAVDNAETSSRADEASQSFAKLLDVDPAMKPADDDLDALGLDSIWRARAMLGLCIALTLQGKGEAANDYFTVLDTSAAPNVVRENAAYWHGAALLRRSDWEGARKAASDVLAQGSSSAGNVRLCVLLVRAAWETKSPTDESEKLASLGIQGLARMRQYEAISTLTAKYRPEPSKDEPFHVLWSRGKIAFAKAEKEKLPGEFATAGQWFQKALQRPEAAEDPIGAAECRYSLAWSQYRREDFESASREFDTAAVALKTLGDAKAVEAAWMAFTSLQQLESRTKDARFQAAAVQSLERLQRDFPDSPQARKAELMQAKLSTKSENPAEVIAKFSAIAADSPNYSLARFDICTARHKLWSQARGKPKLEASARDALLKDVDVYLAASTQSDAVRRVRAASFAIEALLADKPPQADAAAKYLDAMEAAVDKVRDEAVLQDYHYRRLQLAQHRERESDVRTEAAWLVKNAAGTPYELPALILVARDVDKRLSAATASDQASRREEALGIYHRLVKLLGESESAVKGKKNALTANARLARLELESGAYAPAAMRYETVLTAVPDDRAVLRSCGVAWSQAGEYARALPHWQTLVAGSEPASDAFYEAKYHQLECLLKTDPAEAEKTWRRFRVLHPDVKSTAWRERFTILEQASFPAK